MTLLPIVARELRVRARRKGLHVARTLVSLGVVIAAVLVFLLLSGEMPQRVGQTLFLVISSGVLFYSVIAGPLLTADCLSEEKREGTLGLLFLTDLRGYDVVLGKLATTSIHAIYTLLAVLPALGLPLLLGGVTAGEFQRAALVSLNTMFLSLTLGLLVSSVSLHARKATGAATGLMLLLTLGCPALGTWLDYAWRLRGAEIGFATPSPIFGLVHSFDHAYRGHPERFWTSALVVHLIAWGCLILTSVAVKHTWQDRPTDTPSHGWQGCWRRWLVGSGIELEMRRRRLLAVNPFLWRAGRERWKSCAVWCGMSGVGGLWLWGALKFGEDWIGQPASLVTVFLLMAGLKLGVAAEAGNAFGQDRQTGALELVLATPLSVKEIVHGQLLALKRLFFIPVCVTLGLGFLCLLLALADPTPHYPGDERAGLPGVWLAGMIVFVADCAALAILGMWQGLLRRRSHAAIITAAWILGLPWLVFALGLLLLSLRAHPETSWWFLLGLWFVPSLAADLGFGIWAWQKLHAEFRRRTLERASVRETWSNRLVGAWPPRTNLALSPGIKD